MDAKDAHGFTALHLACRSASLQVVNELLVRGAQPDGQGILQKRNGVTALVHARDCLGRAKLTPLQ